ncbi:class I SAM-dependent methyltransferase [Brevibacillus invocatus]|uniref:class I SAM-dependent methyltransferase n=1 Tax=Brevibacillus invocatus TaxID=173959 RepID=UPI002041643E|nr:class I SAM-dependent methyltransferase [Brevibacillus invocatus]MCM3081936.1 class I SAM-dependent methyltransferase [Brevibacillus invocatus]MCM3432346.1 class I SAM-dependent methyltransferase [Brevibacillus invocatus]
MNVDALIANKKSWNEAAPRFYGRNPLPEYGPLAPTEDELQLIGDVTGLKVLEIGCGSGHSLQYMDQKHAGELWGLDLSTKQIESARDLLKNSRAPVMLFESPMEEDPGLPQHYFDLAYSVFAIGWTVDLDRTLANVHRYLKQGGVFVFSWEHPLFSRIASQDGTLVVAKSYHEEGSFDHEAWQETAIMQQFRLSTYLNVCIQQGFSIERVVEDVSLTDEMLKNQTNRWYSYEKAARIPTTMIIKCRKI